MLRWGCAVGGAVGRGVVVAGGWAGADGAEGAAAGVCEFEVADCVLGLVRYDGIVVQWDGMRRWYENLGERGRGAGKIKGRMKERHTAGQQKPPQQDSPATQNVLPQQVDPTGMQKGAKSDEVGMQHWTVFFHSQRSTPPHLHHQSLENWNLTIRVKTLAAHVPRAKIIRTAGEDPCFADGDVVVERCSQGRENSRVGRKPLGEGCRGGSVGCDVAGGGIDAVCGTD